MAKNQKKSIIDKIATKEAIKKNTASVQSFNHYKKARDIIERVEFATGKRVIISYGSGSTVNSELIKDGAYSASA